MKRIIIICMSVLLIALAFGQAVYKGGEIRLSPRLLNYQGFLTDTLSNPITNPSVSMTFGIWSSSGGGTQLWYETQTTSVAKGIFSVILGTLTPIPDTVFTKSADRWLELNYAGITLTPRTRIVSTPYAYTSTLADTAGNARLLQGKDTTALDVRYVNEGQVNSIFTPMIIDTAVTMAKIARAGASTNQVIKWNGAAWQPGSDAVGADADWNYLITDVADTTLQMGGRWGLTRLGNTMYGNADSTHVNFGVVSSTGITGMNNKYCTVAGGRGNAAGGPYATVGGGYSNAADSSYAVVAGGYNNTAGYFYTTVAGGRQNTAGGSYATVAGGYNNIASQLYTTVTGGNTNTASDTGATVSGGRYNKARGRYSVVSGGGGPLSSDSNTASGDYSAIGGGMRNIASGYYTTVAGGFVNEASSSWATVGGGDQNTASGYIAIVAGGYSNSASGEQAFVGGGEDNMASSKYTSVSGGSNNTASDTSATVSGGRYNKARGRYSVVSGGGGALQGDSNSTSGDWSVVGGGRRNIAIGNNSTINGGYSNIANDNYASINGGYSNITNGYYASIGGGLTNTANEYATVGGGQDNDASAAYSTISGGISNSAIHVCATIAGGNRNTASEYCATVAGGRADTAAAYYSFATNYSTRVDASDTNSAAFTTSHTTAKNQVRAAAFSTGTLDFAMDHPDDPMNKILNQYAVGSDEVMLIYSGSVILDASGHATVNLPDYFDNINRNPRIQLTGVGTYEIYVAKKINGNRFSVGGKPGTEVYWTVMAERKDIHAEIARIETPVVQEKKGGLRGHSIDDDAMIGMYDGLHAKNPDLFKFKTEEGRGVHEQSKKMIQEGEIK